MKKDRALKKKVSRILAVSEILSEVMTGDEKENQDVSEAAEMKTKYIHNN